MWNSSVVKIAERCVGQGNPCYVIAEIGSNFDGSLDRAKHLIDLSVEVGANCAKFQSFLPEKIIAKKAFEEKVSFQANWDKSVWQIYGEASFPRKWHEELATYCKDKGIDFSSSPYDKSAVDLLVSLDVPFIKIGSGEITNLAFLQYVAQTMKSIILGTGASTLAEVAEAVDAIRSTGNNQLILLQCVTNYPSHFEHANIRAMKTMEHTFQCPVGYSDHTPGSIVPLVSVALGGCVIEKHFTSDKSRTGPDHPFAMDVNDMREMIQSIRISENALGSPLKILYEEERETVVIQRRSLFTTCPIGKGTRLEPDMMEALRPAVGILPKYAPLIIGKKVQRDLQEGEPITWDSVLS